MKTLTDNKQKVIIELLKKGNSVKEVAIQVGYSKSTILKYKNIYIPITNQLLGKKIINFLRLN